MGRNATPAPEPNVGLVHTLLALAALSSRVVEAMRADSALLVEVQGLRRASGAGESAGLLMRREGFEPPTRSFEGCSSIQLSYRRRPTQSNRRLRARWPPRSFGAGARRVRESHPCRSEVP